MDKIKVQQFEKEFMTMRNNAELKALSTVSLERPLNDREYDKMMALAREVGLK